VNENRREVSQSRLAVLKGWVLSNWPDVEIHGVWTAPSMKKLGRDIKPVPYVDLYAKLRSFRATLTTPASGSGWATAKPWECFAAGVPCFFHPGYDTQGWIIPTLDQVGKVEMGAGMEWLVGWLRVEDPDQLKRRIDGMTDAAWKAIVDIQRKHYERRYVEWLIGRTIDARMSETR
jgi:hypothetical protein